MRYIAFLSIFFLSLSSFAQQLNRQYLEYIEKYKSLAIEQMLAHNIPASITMAQGLYESAAGQGELARKSNNHFGIKHGGTWNGPTVRHDDDRRGERFRKYNTVRESYEDHSQFLLTRSRYASLFSLAPTDYKGWAYGLRQAGYATNPRYATNLINIIETYRLYELDYVDKKALREQEKENDILAMEQMEAERKAAQFKFRPVIHNMEFINGLILVRARQGDTLESIAAEFKRRPYDLMSYNELMDDIQISEGDIIYIEPKRKRASKLHEDQPHVVSSGESMYSISQLYGIKIKYLYKMNHMHPDDDMPPVGTMLRVR